MRSSVRFTRLRIRNFQALGDVTLDLGDVTVIRGPSDVGKSAVVRAVRGLLFNETTRGQIRSGETHLSVTAETTAGTVEMVRHEKDGVSYRVTLPSGESTLHTKVGTNVPPEALAVLGIRRVRLDADTEVAPAVSTQFGGQFPLDLPPGVLSRLLAKVSRLDVVFNAMRLVEADDRDEAVRAEAITTTLASKRRQLADFQGLPRQQAAVQVLEASGAAVEAAESVLGSLRAARDAAREAQTSLRAAEARFVGSQAAAGSGSALLEASASFLGLREARSSAVALRDGIAPLEARASAAERILAVVLPDPAGPVRMRSEMVSVVRSAAALDDLERRVSAASRLPDPDEITRASWVILARRDGTSAGSVKAGHNQVVRHAKQAAAEAETLSGQLSALVDGSSVCPLIQDAWRPGCQERLKHG